MFPATRLRRLRRSEPLRRLVRETVLRPADLIHPIFVEEGAEAPTPIATMPGVERVPEAGLPEAIAQLAGLGLGGVLLFGVPLRKDAEGREALRRDGLLARMVDRAKQAAPELPVIADICFCEYTDHGHCGLLTADGRVDNDATLESLGRQAVVAAAAGADIVGPSAMMDGQVAAIRAALDGAGHADMPIMAYSSKFASGFYGPFRAAAGTALKGDRKTYQMDPANGREALRESALDEAEGADLLMVKPALPYLDVLARLRDRTSLPLVAYQVSGEYAMIKFAAGAGAIDEGVAVMESLTAIRRAGADTVITYFAQEVAAALA